MAKFIKLGEKASQFLDNTVKFHLVGDQVKVLSNLQAKSKKVRRALTSGHLVNATKQEYLDSVKREEELQEVRDTNVLKEDPSSKVKSLEEALRIVKEKNQKLQGENSELKAQLVELTSVDAKEEKNTVSDEDDSVDFMSMTKQECIDYYETEYEVSEDEIKEFSKLTVKKMRDRLIELED